VTSARRAGQLRLKDKALALGAHAGCLLGTRAGSCHVCRDIIDGIIDRAHSKTGRGAQNRALSASSRTQAW
jgi:hypothetical protein